MITTPRQRVLASLAHTQPERVPFSWGFGPTPEMAEVLTHFFAAKGIDWATLQRETDDKCCIVPTYVGPKLPERTDLWGIRRMPVAHGGGSYDEFEHYPLAGAETAADLDRHRWPDPDAFDYASLRASAQTLNPGRYRALYYYGGDVFETYSWMTGIEEALVNLKTNGELVVDALVRITDFYEAKLRKTFQQIGDQLDILFIADDLGGQSGLLMSRETYRAIIQPFHRRVAMAAKELAPQVKVMFHTDGAVFEIIPDLIEAGVEVLEAVQTDAAGMAPEMLKSTYGARLSFQGGISVQQLLPHADKATVERECQRLVRVFGENGGYIAAPSHAIQIGTPPENVLAMLCAVLGRADEQGDFRFAMSELQGIGLAQQGRKVPQW